MVLDCVSFGAKKWEVLSNSLNLFIKSSKPVLKALDDILVRAFLLHTKKDDKAIAQAAGVPEGKVYKQSCCRLQHLILEKANHDESTLLSFVAKPMWECLG